MTYKNEAIHKLLFTPELKAKKSLIIYCTRRDTTFKVASFLNQFPTLGYVKCYNAQMTSTERQDV